MGDCDVCLGDFDGDTADVWLPKIVKARKPHKCFECDREVPVGQEYERIKMLQEGGWDVYDVCLLCREIHIRFACGNGRCVGNLWEDMREVVFPELTMSSKCFAGLSAMAKAEVINRWQQWKGL